VDGKGYPTFGVSTAPHELVRLVSLANFFDDKRTLLPAKRDAPIDVLRSAFALEGRYFDRTTLGLFLRALGAFPPGTTVELSDRQAAVVTRVNPSDTMRPEVRILLGARAGRRVDLKTLNAVERRHELSIVRAILPPLAVREETGADGGRSAWKPPTLTDLNAIMDVSSATASLRPVASLVPSAPPKASVRPVTRPPLPREEPDEGRPAPRVDAVASQRTPSRRPSREPEPSRPSAALGRVPKVVRSNAEIAKLPLDAKAGFVLSLIDGASSVETIVDASGLPKEQVLAAVEELLRHAVIEWT